MLPTSLLAQVVKRGLHTVSGMDLKLIVQKLESFAPKSLAGSWDNVGLLIEPSGEKVVSKIILTNDLTEPVMDECLQVKADLILSYHPPIFRPLKRITSKSWKERIVTKCLENRVALYSPHTAFDAVQDGVNDWLISPFGNGKTQPLEQCFETNQEIMVSFNADEKIQVPFETTIQGNSISFICGQNDANQLVLPKSAKIVKLEKKALPSTGPGRLLIMDKSLTIGQALEKVKGHLGLAHLRIAIAVNGNLDSEINSIGVCAGSGASVLAGCQADLWITGEMSHHEVLDAVHAGTSVILCEHSNTERGYLKLFAKKLTGMLDNHVEVVVSEKDTDPLKIM